MTHLHFKITIIMEEKEIMKEDFIKYVLEHANAEKEGNSKKANRIHKKIATLYQKAKEKGYIDIFHSLLDCKNEDIRIWAASFSLKTEPRKARKALVKLTHSKSIFISFPAKSILESFDKEDWEHLLV